MHRFLTKTTAAAAIAWLALSACSREEREAPAPAAGEPVSAERAAELYARHCAICHGESGDGRGPRRASLFRHPRDFRDPAWREDRTPAEVRAVIRDGVPGSDMPAWGGRLDGAEVAALAEHVLAFAER
jgi:mono/diheme cytochrome c family protein